MALDIGVALPSGGSSVDVDQVLATADAADRHGFDSVWMSEHIVVAPQAADEYGQSLHQFTTLGWVGARHERLGLGTSITILPLHNPFVLAKQAATLQLLSGNRLRLGIGVGWHEPEFRMLGQPFEKRGVRTDEAIRLIRALWAGERSFQGHFWSFDDARFGPLPDRPPPILVGGSSAAAHRRARELGDAWHPSVSATPEDVAAFRRDSPDLPIALRTVVRLGAREGSGVVGEPDQVTERLRAYADAGVSTFILRFSGDDPLGAIERFAAEVVPELRG